MEANGSISNERGLDDVIPGTLNENGTGRSAELVQYCTFEVVDLLVGVDVRRVQEVIPEHEMTPVPLASTGILGLINLRGQIVTALDLRVRMGLPPRPAGVRSMNAVVRCGSEIVSLVVDRTRDVIQPSPDSLSPVPPTVASGIRSVTTGTYKLDSRLLLVLDVDAVVHFQQDNAETYHYPDWVSGLDLEEVFHRNGG